MNESSGLQWALRDSATEALMAMSTEEIRQWLSNHRACVDAGVNVGDVRRRRAQALTVELFRRGEYV